MAENKNAKTPTDDGQPLFTAPPKKQWVGLTDQEIHEIDGYEEDRKMYRFARAIEAKLKEKNKW